MCFFAGVVASLVWVYCRCIAWIGVQDLRGDIAHTRVQVEEELPREIAEVSARRLPCPSLLSDQPYACSGSRHWGLFVGTSIAVFSGGSQQVLVSAALSC